MLEEWIASALTVSSAVLLSPNRRWPFLVGAFGCVLWIHYGNQQHKPAWVVVNIAFLAIYLVNYAKWNDEVPTCPICKKRVGPKF